MENTNKCMSFFRGSISLRVGVSRTLQGTVYQVLSEHALVLFIHRSFKSNQSDLFTYL